MNKMDGKSKDLLKENIEQLKQLFPEVCCEDKIDFDKLKQVLGEYVDDDRERYNFTWNGKGRSLRLSQTPSLGTLRPCKEDSKEWDSTQNLYIEGDNLEVLKLLQKSYYGKVKMIYIDPPYNTGNDFVYPDDFDDSIEHYKEITGQIDSEGNKQSTNPETNGRFHTDWLNMMYPRLKLARNLLSKEGVLFVSIDVHEIENLIKIGKEVFGELNYINALKWKRKKQPSFLSKHIAPVMEYVLIFAKDSMSLEKLSVEKVSDSTKKVINISNQESERIFKEGVEVKGLHNGIIPKGSYDIKTMKVEYMNDIVVKNGRTVVPVKVKAKFLNTQERITEFIDNGLLFITSKMGLRRYVSEDEKEKEKAITDLLVDWGDNQDSENEQLEMFGEKYFDYTKPINLLYNLTKSCTKNNDIILDFFSGSATTAHAVMQLNAEDGGDRRFIMVQLPEVCGEKTEAYKAGYKNICEIGKERIRRAGEKIKAQIEEENAQLKIDDEPKKVPDIGFRVFKLDSSNLKKWHPDYDDLEKTLLDSIENYVEGRSELDVVYEIILKMGLDLTYPVDELDVNGRKIYSVAFGALMICLDDHITKEIADGMISLYQEYQPELWKVVFKDNGFESDSAKTNIKEQLKAAGLEEDAFTTI